MSGRVDEEVPHVLGAATGRMVVRRIAADVNCHRTCRHVVARSNPSVDCSHLDQGHRSKRQSHHRSPSEPSRLAGRSHRSPARADPTPRPRAARPPLMTPGPTAVSVTVPSRTADSGAFAKSIDLGLDEAPLEVRVDHARRLRRRPASMNCLGLRTRRRRHRRRLNERERQNRPIPPLSRQRRKLAD